MASDWIHKLSPAMSNEEPHNNADQFVVGSHLPGNSPTDQDNQTYPATMRQEMGCRQVAKGRGQGSRRKGCWPKEMRQAWAKGRADRATGMMGEVQTERQHLFQLTLNAITVRHSEDDS